MFQPEKKKKKKKKKQSHMARCECYKLNSSRIKDYQLIVRKAQNKIKIKNGKRPIFHGLASIVLFQNIFIVIMLLRGVFRRKTTSL
jgi:hypothetical protein